MSGMGSLAPKFRGMNQHRHNNSAVKVEEKRLQKLLDLIDTRMQDQRSKLKRQMEDTQQAAEEMEEKKHKATLQLLKNYFEVTSGRGGMNPIHNHMHEERMIGVLSEPSLATVPEIDPDVLAKPRSMYDRITRSFDTSRLPMIAPNHRNIVHQPKSLPTTMPNSNRSDSTSDEDSLKVVVTPRVTPGSTPRNEHTPTNSIEDLPWNEPPKKPVPINAASDPYQPRASHHKINEGYLSPQGRNGYSFDNSKYDKLNGHTYQRGTIRPTSNFYEDVEMPTPRLGDVVSSKRGITRHLSLRRTMGTSTGSTISLSELQPTRKQQAANKLKHALKTVRIPR